MEGSSICLFVLCYCKFYQFEGLNVWENGNHPLYPRYLFIHTLSTSRMSNFSTRCKFITNQASSAHKYQLSSPKTNLSFVFLCDRRGKNLLYDIVKLLIFVLFVFLHTFIYFIMKDNHKNFRRIVVPQSFLRNDSTACLLTKYERSLAFTSVLFGKSKG